MSRYKKNYFYIVQLWFLFIIMRISLNRGSVAYILLLIILAQLKKIVCCTEDFVIIIEVR